MHSIPGESLFRRYPRKSLFNGKPVPLTMSFEGDSGISVNRSKYSEPQDVLEPDCCDGEHRPECVILDIHVSEMPKEIATTDETGRVFRFRMVHKPKDTCFAARFGAITREVSSSRLRDRRST